MSDGEIKYYGEYAPFLNDDEKEKAREYLLMWKKCLLYRLKRDRFDVEVFDENWIEKEAMHDRLFDQNSTLALKIALKATWNYELK